MPEGHGFRCCSGAPPGCPILSDPENDFEFRCPMSKQIDPNCSCGFPGLIHGSHQGDHVAVSGDFVILFSIVPHEKTTLDFVSGPSVLCECAPFSRDALRTSMFAAQRPVRVEIEKSSHCPFVRFCQLIIINLTVALHGAPFTNSICYPASMSL